MIKGGTAVARAALWLLLLPGFARGGEPFRLVVGYSRSSVENSYRLTGRPSP